MVIAHGWRGKDPDGEQLRIVKCAKGDTNMWQWVPHSDPTRNYPRMVEAIKRAIVRGSVNRARFVWIQGESDTWESEQFALGWLEGLKKLIGQLRLDLDQPTMEAVVVVLSEPFRKPSPWLPMIVLAQIDAAGFPWVSSVTSQGCSKSSGMIHYDESGIVELGRRITAKLTKGM